MRVPMVLDSLSAGDRVQLLEVYARSVMLLELQRPLAWVDLFAPDAVVRHEGLPGLQEIESKGREELLRLAEQLSHGELEAGARHPASPPRCRHTLSNITLFGTGPRYALGYAFLTVTTFTTTGPPRWRASGRYSDRLFRCSAGCWRFESRIFRGDAAIAGPTSRGPQIPSAERSGALLDAELDERPSP